jgi:hypothetical protein
MRASRAVSRSCPVNINLSAQWSYHEETRKKFRRNQWRCIVIPRASFNKDRLCNACAAAAALRRARVTGGEGNGRKRGILTSKKEEQRHNLESSCEMSIRPRPGPETRDFTHSLIGERSPLPVRPPARSVRVSAGLTRNCPRGPVREIYDRQ